MTDPLEPLLRPPHIEPLPPPAGHYDEIVRRARSRRNRRTAVTAAVLTAAVLGASFGGSAALIRSADPNTPAAHQSPVVSGSQPVPSAASSSHTSVVADPGTGPVPAHFRPWSVSAVSARQTWLLGDAPCAHAPCTSLVVTGDGGRTWRGLPAPRAALPASHFDQVPTLKLVSEVRFANERDGWVFGGGLFATHDGGRHWQPVFIRDPDGDFLTVTALETDGASGYALVDNCRAGAGDGCGAMALYSARVGSDDWRPVPRVAVGPHGSAAKLTVSGAGVLVVAQSTRVRAWLHRSSWAEVRPPCVGDALPLGLSASATGGRLFALCADGVAAGSVYLTRLVSDDGGAHWRTVAGPALQVANGGFLSFAAASDSVLAVATASIDLRGDLVRSADGGRSFSAAGLPPLPNGWWYVGARTSTSLVALPGRPDGSVWSSHDSGLTWQSYRFR